MNAIRFSPEAIQDIRLAFDWYEGAQRGLGSEFSRQVAEGIRRIDDHPEAWPILRGRVRRIRIQRFPYGVLYDHGRGHITILAVMHMHRHPEKWLGRI